MAAVGGTNT
jgi:hypothetical protein